MKQLKIIAILIALYTSVNGQVYLSEDFQGGIPGTWTVVDNDGLTPDNSVIFVNDAWVAYEENEDELDTVALSTSHYQPAGMADDWLISPPIQIDFHTMLTWRARALDSLKSDGYEVRISTTNPTLPDFLANPALFTISEENEFWTKRSVDLSLMGYTNDTVYLAFRNNSSSKYLLAIDDIIVWDCTLLNAEAGILDSSVTVSCSGNPALNLGLSPSFVDAAPGNIINGTTSDIPNWDPLPGRPFEDGDCCASPGSSPPYNVVSFQITVTGNYDIHQAQTGYDGVIYIYKDPFSLIQNPPITYVAGNDDSADVAGFGISFIDNVALTQGETYYLVSTGFNDGEAGNFTTTISGPGDLLIETITLDELPYDYGFVIVDSTGVAVAIGDDLSDETTFPGSAAGDAFRVYGISYVEANLNLSSLVGQPLSNIIDLTDSSNCVAITADPHEVIILQGLVVDAGENDTICPGEVAELLATGTGTTYLWNTGETTTNIGVEPEATQTYSVTATSGSGCSATDQVTVIVFTSDGGVIDPGPLFVCESDSSLNLDLQPEFTASFAQSLTNEINGNTAVNFTWAPLSGRPRADGTCCTGFNSLYDIVSFQVSSTGIYSIHQTQDNYDGYLLLYTEPFDLTQNPPVTFIAGSDDSAGVSGISYIDSAYLNVGQTYYLISTGYALLDYGDYESTISGPGSLLLIGPPDSTFFSYDFVIVNDAGSIMTISQDLSDANVYPGSATGTEYSVCGVSYVRDSLNLNDYVGGPYSVLEGVPCLSLTDTCFNVKIFTTPVANAGIDDTLCSTDTAFVSANIPVYGTGTWRLISGSGIITDDTLANTSIINPGVGNNQFSWTVDNGGCEEADTVNIFVYPVLTADAGENDTICRGKFASLTASGGASYLWSNGEMTATINPAPLSSSFYYVTVTDTNGCRASDTAIVIVKPSPVVNVPDASFCLGSSTTLSALSGGATYIWSPGGATTPTITVDSPGLYYVTVTRGGCSVTDTAEVTLSSSLTVNLNDHTLCDGDSITLNAGNAGVSYIWSTSDTTPTITVTDAGDYSVTVTDTANCTGIDTSTVIISPSPIVDAGNNDTICVGASALLVATSSGIGPFSFVWNTGQMNDSIVISPSQSKSYSVTITDTNDCKASDSLLVIVNPMPIASASSDVDICFGDTAILTASGGQYYEWNTGDITSFISVSPINTSSFKVIVTDANGCIDSAKVLVTVNPLPLADAGMNDTICSGATATLNATGGISYQWNDGPTSAVRMVSPFTTETYIVEATDINGCTDTDSVIIVVQQPLMVNISDTSICYGDSVALLASGGISYLWNIGSTDSVITVSPSNDSTYTVTITGADGCIATDSILVTVNQLPIADAGTNQVICEGESVQLTATGGTSYSWSTGDMTATISVSPTIDKVYMITVTDSQGCQNSAQVTVNVLDAPTVILTGLDSAYCTTDGSVTLTGSPAGGIFSGPGVTDSLFNPAVADSGNHMIAYTFTDSITGCSATDMAQISVSVCTGILLSNYGVIHVFPNPTDHDLIISLTYMVSHDPVVVRLYDVFGRLNYEREIEVSYQSKQQTILNIKDLPANTYWLKIVQNDQPIFSTPVIKIKE